MNARPAIRQRLIEIRMRRWLLVAKHPFVAPACPPARARKNYWRLCARFPEVMQRLNLNELSVYE